MSADPLNALAALNEPVRRALYEAVAKSPRPLTRDACAEAAGTNRALAAFHLDKLVDAGLLAVEYRRVSGKSGPGAGRPAKLYRRSEQDIAVQIPPRRYADAGQLLASAVEAPAGRKAREALQDVARDAGRRMGEEAAQRAGERSGADRRLAEALTLLAEHGYEPFVGEDGGIRLRNCPFHQLAEHHRELVCGMNLALMNGVQDALALRGLSPVLRPEPGSCCVAFVPAKGRKKKA